MWFVVVDIVTVDVVAAVVVVWVVDVWRPSSGALSSPHQARVTIG
jgi:hypothetical protein